MKISVRHENKGSYLRLIGKGDQNNLTDILDGTRQSQLLVRANPSRLIMLDYREVKFNVPLSEAFNLVRFYETELPQVRNMAIAALVDKKYEAISQQWKSVGTQRKFTFEVFYNEEDAEKWLLKQAKSISN